MKPQKFTFKDTAKIDLGTKVIYRYSVFSKLFGLSYMKVNGRHPEDRNKYTKEHDCQFIIYVTSGNGKIYAGNEVFDVKVGDTVHVPTENKFAAEGAQLEYVEIQIPAWYQEQAEIVSE